MGDCEERPETFLPSFPSFHTHFSFLPSFHLHFFFLPSTLFLPPFFSSFLPSSLPSIYTLSSSPPRYKYFYCSPGTDIRSVFTVGAFWHSTCTNILIPK